MQPKLYLARTHFEKDIDKPRIIHWYCPERLKPLADCQELIADYHLCPDEPQKRQLKNTELGNEIMITTLKREY